MNSDANIQSDAWSCRVRCAVAKTGLKWESRLGIWREPRREATLVFGALWEEC